MDVDLDRRRAMIVPVLRSWTMEGRAHVELTDPVNAGEAEAPASTLFVPQTEADRDEVRSALERILASPQFKTTTRGPALLRHIVEYTITGRTDQLKERILGIEVFGRNADYDTSLDPVVRVTASRVRQRIARYYGEEGAESPVRIQLPSGSYAAEFWVPDHSAEAPDRPVVDGGIAGVAAPARRPLLPRGRRRRWLAAFAIVALVGVAGVLTGLGWKRAPLDRFWAPVLASSSPVTLCLGYGIQRSQPGDLVQPLTIFEQRRQDSVNWPDAITLTRVAELLAARGKTTTFRRDISTSLTDLRTGPAVLIGAFNNDWVLRLTPELRFRFDRDRAAFVMWIVDSKNPSNRDWKVVYSSAFADYKEDFGVITRVLDPTTERTVVVLGGLGSYGTIAAGEFLTNSKYLAAFAERAPSGWEEKNLQIVVGTTVINGTSGPPRVLAIHTW